MALKATITSQSDVTIIRLDGKITLGDGSGVLRETVAKAFADGVTKVLLDLGGVSYIDSAGLGELVGCYTSAKHKGATLKLLHLQKRVEGLMQMTKLYLLFATFEDESAAIQSFADGPAVSA
jgi:anti-sigma B factor antagonist